MIAIWGFGQHKVDEEESARVMRDHAAGRVDRDGRPICQICGEPATRHVPIIDQSWFNKLPLVRWLNRLYALPWIYSVIVNDEGMESLCGAHGTQAIEHLEHFIANLRADHAEFNAVQLEKVGMMNRVELENRLRNSEDNVRARIGAPTLRATRGNYEDQTHSMPPTLTGKSEEMEK